MENLETLTDNELYLQRLKACNALAKFEAAHAKGVDDYSGWMAAALDRIAAIEDEELRRARSLFDSTGIRHELACSPRACGACGWKSRKDVCPSCGNDVDC